MEQGVKGQKGSTACCLMLLQWHVFLLSDKRQVKRSGHPAFFKESTGMLKWCLLHHVPDATCDLAHDKHHHECSHAAVRASKPPLRLIVLL